MVAPNTEDRPIAELKTRPTGESVEEFLDGVADEDRRRDCRVLADLMRQATGCEPRMWGPSIVGFGRYHYRYESGREGDWFLAGFSPRRQDLTVYLMAGLARFEPLLGRLGKHKVGKSCLYIKKLADVDLAILRQMLEESIRHVRRADR